VCCGTRRVAQTATAAAAAALVSCEIALIIISASDAQYVEHRPYFAAAHNAKALAAMRYAVRVCARFTQRAQNRRARLMRSKERLVIGTKRRTLRDYYHCAISTRGAENKNLTFVTSKEGAAT
jgi:hypothetical protein